MLYLRVPEQLPATTTKGGEGGRVPNSEEDTVTQAVHAAGMLLFWYMFCLFYLIFNCPRSIKLYTGVAHYYNECPCT